MLVLLIRYALPVLLQAAIKAGLINEVEKVLIQFGMSLKTYPEYPVGRNGQQEETSLHAKTNITPKG